MSINYNTLHRLVREVEHGVAATIQYTWLDLAQEIIRLHQGLQEMRSDMRDSTLCNGGTDVPYLQGLAAQAEQIIRQIDQILGETNDRG